ncbi:MAG: nucleoside phosphorylase [Halobacteriota archaeon]|uniref:nucleoside phosphorylase n=1 Tax=Natronomonas sp. TaxID=2184060 RepID=UPI00397479D1
MIPDYGPTYDAEALFSPMESVSSTEGRPDLPPAIILGFQDALYEKIKDTGTPIDPDTRRPFEYHAISDSVGFIPVQRMGVGAPVAAIATEKAIGSGAECVVMLGGSAALQPDVPADAALLPTRAVRDEGASYHYLPPEETVRPTPELLGRLGDAFSKHAVETRRGPTWTTSALFRETIPQLEHYRGEGFVSLCMETSAIWAVCRYRGVDTATVHGIDGYAVPGEQIPTEAFTNHLPELLGPTVEALEAHVGGG